MESSFANEYVLWVGVIAYAAHIMEEYNFDWNAWAENLSGLSIGWPSFFVTNAAVIVLGIACAQIGWQCPAISLMFPALMLINGIIFHLGPTLVRRRFSPGTITGVFFFVPAGIWAFQAAHQDGVLTSLTILVSIFGGVIIMIYPVVLIRLKNKLEKQDIG